MQASSPVHSWILSNSIAVTIAIFLIRRYAMRVALACFTKSWIQLKQPEHQEEHQPEHEYSTIRQVQTNNELYADFKERHATGFERKSVRH